MIIKLSIFLYLYYAFLFLCAVYSLVAIYHLLRFGFKNFVTLTSVLVYISFALIIIYFSFTFIGTVDWNMGISLFGHMADQSGQLDF